MVVFAWQCAFTLSFLLVSRSILQSSSKPRVSMRLRQLIVPDSENDKSNEPNAWKKTEFDHLPDDAFGAPIGEMPSVSSRLNYGDDDSVEDENALQDLWVLGCGTLGTLAVKEYSSMFPSSKIVAETKTDKRHSIIAAISSGISCRLASNRSQDDRRLARNMIVCIPPSASQNNEEYEQLLGDAFRLWAGPNFGTLVFTSSTVVYGDKNQDRMDEKFRTDSRTDRAARMISAETAVLERGGSVIRLAGLYNPERGPHAFWLKTGKVSSNPDGVLNMLHYEDAARAALAVIAASQHGKVFLASDDVPVTRKEICEAALVSGCFPGATMPDFTDEVGAKGKTTDCSWTRKVLGWKPRYQSFCHTMYAVAGKEYESNKVASSALWTPGDDEDWAL